MPIEYKKDAYGMLYQIENTLRIKIALIMKKEYGIDWIIRAPLKEKYEALKRDDLNDLHVYELIRLINSFECIQKEINIPVKKFNWIPYIRNKIAHCKVISYSEYNLLKNIYAQLLKGNYLYN